MLINFCHVSIFPCWRCSAMQQSTSASAATGAARALANLPKHRCAPAGGSRLPAMRVQSSLAAKVSLYIPTHDRCEPPASQIVRKTSQNILLRQFQARSESKKHRLERPDEGEERSSKVARKS